MSKKCLGFSIKPNRYRQANIVQIPDTHDTHEQQISRVDLWDGIEDFWLLIQTSGCQLGCPGQALAVPPIIEIDTVISVKCY